MLDLTNARAYDLTSLTGRPVATERVTAVKTFDANRRVVAALLLGGLGGLAVMGVVWGIVVIIQLFVYIPQTAKSYLIVIPILVAALSAWLFGTKSDTGIERSRQLKELRAGKRTLGTFYVCGMPIEPLRSEFGWIASNTVPVDTPDKSVETLDGVFS